MSAPADSREPTWHTVALIRAAVTSWTKGDLRHAEGMARAAWREHTEEPARQREDR